MNREQLEPETEGFNLLLKALLDAGFAELTMDCFRLVKLWDSDLLVYGWRQKMIMVPWTSSS